MILQNRQKQIVSKEHESLNDVWDLVEANQHGPFKGFPQTSEVITSTNPFWTFCERVYEWNIRECEGYVMFKLPCFG